MRLWPPQSECVDWQSRRWIRQFSTLDALLAGVSFSHINYINIFNKFNKLINQTKYMRRSANRYNACASFTSCLIAPTTPPRFPVPKWPIWSRGWMPCQSTMSMRHCVRSAPVVTPSIATIATFKWTAASWSASMSRLRRLSCSSKRSKFSKIELSGGSTVATRTMWRRRRMTLKWRRLGQLWQNVLECLK